MRIKKLLFLLCFGLLTNSNLQAKKLSGEIIFPDDTLEATIEVPIIWSTGEPDFYALQQRVTYFVGGERKRQKVKPEEAQEIRFEYEGMVFQMRSVQNPADVLFKSKDFLKLEIEGAVSLFAYYQQEGATGGRDDEFDNDGRRITYIVKKGKEEAMTVSPLSFRWDMTDFFSECLTLVDKIEHRDLRRRDIKEIVSYYNEVCVDEPERSTEMVNPTSLVEKTSNKITPFLMFDGRAEEAMNFYEALFEDAEIIFIERYENSGETIDGKVYQAIMQIHGQEVRFFDSSIKHDFTFTPAISFFVNCDSELEIYKFFVELSKDGLVRMELDNYGFSKKFGWVEDKFGISWQLNFMGE